MRDGTFILSPIHASLNSLNPMKVVLHLGKTLLFAHLTMGCEYFGFLLNINHAEMYDTQSQTEHAQFKFEQGSLANCFLGKTET